MKNNATRLDLLLIDDHPAIRKGLSILLGTRHHKVAAEAKGRAEALALLDQRHFDIALLDLTLQDGSGLDLLPEMEARGISTLVYTMHEDTEIIDRALRHGALGYVSKQEEEDILFTAIETVAAGNRYLSPCAVQCLEENRTKPHEPTDVLSDRERQVFVMLGKGRGITEIAKVLGLSRRTVETHCNRMVTKLDLQNRAELRKYAISIV